MNHNVEKVKEVKGELRKKPHIPSLFDFFVVIILEISL
jgi:hypothetical protein